MSNHVAAARYGRPTRYGGAGNGHTAPRRVWLPSIVEATGRTMCATWDDDELTWMIGVDVACPSQWSQADHSFKNFGAGGGWDGSTLSMTMKKSPWVGKTDDRAVWLSGANTDGSIMYREPSSGQWTVPWSNASADGGSLVYYGEVEEGAGTDPRTAGSRLGCFVGDRTFIACLRDAAPTRGIVKQDTVGGTWVAWAFASSINFTALQKSPQWDAIYATADAKVGSGTVDGVYIMTGLTSGTATYRRIDTVGVNAPTLADVRDVDVIQRGTTDYLLVVVGTTTDRGVWECIITTDPSAGGFTPSTDITWRKVFTPEDTTNDRPQSVVLLAESGGLQGAMVGEFSANTAGTGTYNESTGISNGYFRCIYKTANVLAVTPTWTGITNATNVDVQTYGVDAVTHPHILTIAGESATEKARLGGSQYTNQGLMVNGDRTQVVAVGKTTPWICTNPNEATPMWRPFSHGLGALGGSNQGVVVSEKSKGYVAFNDDDRGGYFFEHGTPPTYHYVLANDNTGIPTSDNTTRTCVASVLGVENTSGGILFASHDSRGYRVRSPFSAVVVSTPTIVGVGALAEANSTTVSVPVPAGVLAGDLLVMHGMTRNQAAGSFPAQAGWTEGSVVGTSQSTNQRAEIWYRYAVGGETSFTLTAAGSGTLLGVITCLRGIVPATPEDVAGSKDGNTAAATYTFPTPVDTVTSGALSMHFVSTSDANALSLTTANGYTVGYSGASYDSTVGTSGSLAMAYKIQTTPGDVGAPTWTETVNGNDGWIGFNYAYRSAGSTGGQAAILQKDFVASNGFSAGNDLAGFHDFLDSGASLRYLSIDRAQGIVRSAAGGGSPDAVVQALTTVATRTILQTNGSGCFWLCIPDLGIYRSTDYCATWTLWWNKAIAAQDYRWSGHIVRDETDHNTLWVTFENGGAWKVPNAHTAAVGSGTGGSVPTGAAKVTGGALPLGTERMGPITVDPFNKTVWVLRHPGAVKTGARLYRLPFGSGTTWVEEVDDEIREGANLAQGFSIYAGKGILPTNGQGTLRRVP